MNHDPKIDKETLAGIRNRKEHQYRVRNLTPPTVEEMHERFLVDQLEIAIDNALNELSPRDREIIQRVVRNGEQANLVAESLEISRATVHRRIPKALPQMRRILRRSIIVQAILDNENEELHPST